MFLAGCAGVVQQECCGFSGPIWRTVLSPFDPLRSCEPGVLLLYDLFISSFFCLFQTLPFPILFAILRLTLSQEFAIYYNVHRLHTCIILCKSSIMPISYRRVYSDATMHAASFFLNSSQLLMSSYH